MDASDNPCWHHPRPMRVVLHNIHLAEVVSNCVVETKGCLREVLGISLQVGSVIAREQRKIAQYDSHASGHRIPPGLGTGNEAALNQLFR